MLVAVGSWNRLSIWGVSYCSNHEQGTTQQARHSSSQGTNGSSNQLETFYFGSVNLNSNTHEKIVPSCVRISGRTICDSESICSINGTVTVGTKCGVIYHYRYHSANDSRTGNEGETTWPPQSFRIHNSSHQLKPSIIFILMHKFRPFQRYMNIDTVTVMDINDSNLEGCHIVSSSDGFINFFSRESLPLNLGSDLTVNNNENLNTFRLHKEAVTSMCVTDMTDSLNEMKDKCKYHIITSSRDGSIKYGELSTDACNSSSSLTKDMSEICTSVDPCIGISLDTTQLMVAIGYVRFGQHDNSRDNQSLRALRKNHCLVKHAPNPLVSPKWVLQKESMITIINQICKDLTKDVSLIGLSLYFLYCIETLSGDVFGEVDLTIGTVNALGTIDEVRRAMMEAKKARNQSRKGSDAFADHEKGTVGGVDGDAVGGERSNDGNHDLEGHANEERVVSEEAGADDDQEDMNDPRDDVLSDEDDDNDDGYEKQSTRSMSEDTHLSSSSNSNRRKRYSTAGVSELGEKLELQRLRRLQSRLERVVNILLEASMELCEVDKGDVVVDPSEDKSAIKEEILFTIPDGTIYIEKLKVIYLFLFYRY